MKKLLIVTLSLLLTGFAASAQKVTIGTNLLEWANLLTYNGEVSYSFKRHISIYAGGRFNNTKIDKSSVKHVIIQNRQTTAYAGLRYWPWFINSGLWFGAKGQYSEFGRSGLWRSAYETGRAAGAGVSVGYTIMLTKHLNMEFGAGVWGGSYLEYTLYDCPICMNVREHGGRMFFDLDDLMVSLVFVL